MGNVTYYFITGLFLGTCAAVLVVAYNKLVLGKLVRALIKAEANHPSFARSMEQLGVKANIFLRAELRRTNGLFRKFVREPDDGSEEKKGYYYIPEDLLYRAGRLYGGKDVDGLMVAAVLIIIFLFYGIVIFYLPSFIDQFNRLIGSIG